MAPAEPRRDPARNRVALLSARIVLIALAAVAAVVGAHALDRQHRCDRAIARVNRVAPAAPEAQAIAAGHDLVTSCPAPRSIIQPLFYLGAAHTPAAVAAARTLTRRNPDDYVGWLLLASVEHDRRAVRLANARVEALRPQVTR